MPRLARVVLPGYPHHISQRGNRRQRVFFNVGDYAHYLQLIAQSCLKAQTECLAYCLMPNHVHLVLTPKNESGLRIALSEAHRQYTRGINFWYGWPGHLWQERFHSVPMNEAYLAAAVRYIELNPVRARLVNQAAEWKWSSVRAHLTGTDDLFVRVEPMLSMYSDWADYLAEPDQDKLRRIRMHTRTGRPLGDSRFIRTAGLLTGRNLERQKPGRKPHCNAKSVDGKQVNCPPEFP